MAIRIFVLCAALFAAVLTAAVPTPMGLGAVAASATAAASHADGVWYGKLASVSVARRTIVFTAACTLRRGGRWVPTTRITTTVKLGQPVGLKIYYRPNGDPAAGHPQSANLGTVAFIANGKPSADFPRGWAITVSHGVAVLVEEGSGIYGDPSCLTSAATRRFVNSRTQGSFAQWGSWARSRQTSFLAILRRSGCLGTPHATVPG